MKRTLVDRAGYLPCLGNIRCHFEQDESTFLEEKYIVYDH